MKSVSYPEPFKISGLQKNYSQFLQLFLIGYLLEEPQNYILSSLVIQKVSQGVKMCVTQS